MSTRIKKNNSTRTARRGPFSLLAEFELATGCSSGKKCAPFYFSPVFGGVGLAPSGGAKIGRQAGRVAKVVGGGIIEK